MCEASSSPPVVSQRGDSRRYRRPLSRQGLAVLAQELIHFRIRCAQQGCLAEGPCQHIMNVRLRQRLVLQQHLGQPVQVLLLLRLQAGSTCTSAGGSLGSSCTLWVSACVCAPAALWSRNAGACEPPASHRLPPHLAATLPFLESGMHRRCKVLLTGAAGLRAMIFTSSALGSPHISLAAFCMPCSAWWQAVWLHI